MADMELIPDLVNDEDDEVKYTEVEVKETRKTPGLVVEKVEKKVPVTILTGYLGSGKSTLLEQIAKRGDRKLAVILNEFGDSVEIEKSLQIRDKGNDKVEEWLDLGNGCLCCSVKDNGVSAIERLVAKRQDFDHIILETTGLADPAPIATMFWLDDALSSNVYIDGVVTVLDSETIERCLDDTHNDLNGNHEEAGKHLKHLGKDLSIAHLQIALADVILLNKFDRVESDLGHVGSIKDRVQGINSIAPIYSTTYGDIDLDKILGLHAYEAKDVEKLIKVDTDYHDHSMTTVTLNFPELTADQMDQFELFLQKILWQEGIDDDAMEIHRTKGLVLQANDDYKVIQGVRKTYDMLPGVKPREELGLYTSRLVLIGRHIKDLSKEFEEVVGVTPTSGGHHHDHDHDHDHHDHDHTHNHPHDHPHH